MEPEIQSWSAMCKQDPSLLTIKSHRTRPEFLCLFGLVFLATPSDTRGSLLALLPGIIPGGFRISYVMPEMKHRSAVCKANILLAELSVLVWPVF